MTSQLSQVREYCLSLLLIKLTTPRHALRKSGTFTGLDFAPPRRFKEGSQAGSDAGSIRSYRSNVSQMQLHNIRNGAYRVSRIPKEVAGTRDDMFTALKPKWDMRGDGVGTPTLR